LSHLQLDDIEALNYDDLGAVAKLSRSGVYKDIMEVCGCGSHGTELILMLRVALYACTYFM